MTCDLTRRAVPSDTCIPPGWAFRVGFAFGAVFGLVGGVVCCAVL
jgi:hypothetical protein